MELAMEFGLVMFKFVIWNWTMYVVYGNICCNLYGCDCNMNSVEMVVMVFGNWMKYGIYKTWLYLEIEFEFVFEHDYMEFEWICDMMEIRGWIFRSKFGLDGKLNELEFEWIGIWFQNDFVLKMVIWNEHG